MNYNYSHDSHDSRDSQMLPIQNGSVARFYTGQQAYCQKKCTPFLKNQSDPWKNEKFYEVHRNGTITYEKRNSSGEPIYIMDENGNEWNNLTLPKDVNIVEISCLSLQ